MKAVQIVIEDQLLRRVGRSARRLKSSRSATIRRLVELGLENEALGALARADAQAYARRPETEEERAAFRALTRSQQRVMSDLARRDHW